MRFIVEVRGLAIVTVAEDSYGREIPLADGVEGASDPVRLSVGADNPTAARLRVHEMLQRLLDDELQGDIPRDRGPSSY